MLVGLLAFLIQDWRDLQITLGILVFLLVGLYFVLPESPRWLIAQRKYDEAKKVSERWKSKFPSVTDKCQQGDLARSRHER
jgi:OCT family organic cation transporter-like MFS transporter 4/5